MKKKLVILIILVFISLGAFLAWQVYQAVYGASVEESFILWVDDETELDEIIADYGSHFNKVENFENIARYKGLEEKLKVGRYEIKAGSSANSVVNQLIAGRQSPMRLVVNLVKNLEGLAGLLGRELYPDSLSYLQYFRSTEFLELYGLENSEALGFFIPNTYEVYWTESPAAFAERMQRERERFWKQRAESLASSALERDEVITLASIVESETAQGDEMPLVAGLYLNRLEQNIKLQSDPTVIYAWEKAHPGSHIKRVLFKHLEIESPYNTYQNTGLPPGPIRIVSPQAIDAVLKAKDHAYIFMCADPERPGYHAFATNLREHNTNRRRYINWLKEQRRLAAKP